MLCKEVIGCIFALRRISGSKEEIYINEMEVLPERQGLGIGKQLLNAVNIASDRRMGNLQVYI